jgi:toluene monooxygenase system protein D
VTQPRAPSDVGPVLEANDAGRAVVTAIQSLNDGVRVQDRGAYLRVSVPGRCVVTRRAIETALGRSLEWPGGLELVMPAFQGIFSLDDERAEWRFERA